LHDSHHLLKVALMPFFGIKDATLNLFIDVIFYLWGVPLMPKNGIKAT